MASIKRKITIFGTPQAKYRPFLGLVMHPLGVEFLSTLLDSCLIIWSCEDALTFSHSSLVATAKWPPHYTAPSDSQRARCRSKD